MPSHTTEAAASPFRSKCAVPIHQVSGPMCRFRYFTPILASSSSRSIQMMSKYWSVCAQVGKVVFTECEPIEVFWYYVSEKVVRLPRRLLRQSESQLFPERSLVWVDVLIFHFVICLTGFTKQSLVTTCAGPSSSDAASLHKSLDHSPQLKRTASFSERSMSPAVAKNFLQGREGHQHSFHAGSQDDHC